MANDQFLDIDRGKFLILRDSVSVRASLRQFRVFSYLWDHPEFVRSRAQIIDHCWPDGTAADIYEMNVNSTIKRLRQKLHKAFGQECDPIGMYFGEGYFFRREYKRLRQSSLDYTLLSDSFEFNIEGTS